MTKARAAMKWNPWTTKGGTLQLQEWPDHLPGDVLVEVDVFEDWDGPVADSAGSLLHRSTDGWCSTGEFDPKRAVRIADVLQALFAHIDAHPQTTYTLRTLHPERVKLGFGEKACCPCGRDNPNRRVAGGANWQCECGQVVNRWHRPNVTLSLGPLATQPEADRLVPDALRCADLVAGVRLFVVPVERIDFVYPKSLWPDGPDRCCSGWECGCQGAPIEPPLWMDMSGNRITRIRVAGGEQPLHPDWVRCVRDQCAAAGVAFVFDGWGDWMPIQHVPDGPGTEYIKGFHFFRCGLSTCEGEDCSACKIVCLVGSEHSGRTLDGREWPGREGEAG